MSRIKMVFAFLLCCVAIGFSQNNPDTRTDASDTGPQTVWMPASVMAGMGSHKVLPQYPKDALIKGIQGDVVFKIGVGENGKIVRSQPLSGNPLLVAAAEDAIPEFRRSRPWLVRRSALNGGAAV